MNEREETRSALRNQRKRVTEGNEAELIEVLSEEVKEHVLWTNFLRAELHYPYPVGPI